MEEDVQSARLRVAQGPRLSLHEPLYQSADVLHTNSHLDVGLGLFRSCHAARY